MLGDLEQTELRSHIVIADMEAGLGTLSRMASNHVDAVLVVANPSAKAIEVARRAVEMIRERAIGPVLVIANRVQGQDDVALIRRAVPVAELLAIPDDPAVEEADREAIAPIDRDPSSPALQAIEKLAMRLLQDGAAGS